MALRPENSATKSRRLEDLSIDNSTCIYRHSPIYRVDLSSCCVVLVSLHCDNWKLYTSIYRNVCSCIFKQTFQSIYLLSNTHSKNFENIYQKTSICGIKKTTRQLSQSTTVLKLYGYRHFTLISVHSTSVGICLQKMYVYRPAPGNIYRFTQWGQCKTMGTSDYLT